MCAIIGFEAGTERKHEERIEEYLKILEERGDQSFGYFYRTLDGETYFNKALTVEPLLQQIKDTPKGAWCFMHARKASAGMSGGTADARLAKAHPVDSDDKLITLIHNGTKASIHDTVKGSISDSQGLATLLSIAWKGRRDYYGNIGVVIYERAGVVHLYKDGTRPLVMSEDNTIFASEPLFDDIKWKNISNTYTLTTGTDVILDITKKGLGLKFGVLVDIKFDIATNTVHNFSTKGYPKTTTCTICSKSHIKQINTFGCCVCKIEGRVATAYKQGKKHNTNYTKKLAPGVLVESDKDAAKLHEDTLYGSDFSLLKDVGYTLPNYGGYALVKADNLYTTTDGLIFVKPTATGKFLVKVDKIIVDRSQGNAKYAWNPKTATSVQILGDLDVNKVIPIKENLDISYASKNIADNRHILTGKIVSKESGKETSTSFGKLIGYKKYIK